MDLRNPDVWLSHLLENLSEDKWSAPLSDDNPDWEYIDGEIVKLGSLNHSQLDIPEIQRRGLQLLASESKDFRLLAHLLRTLQHAGEHLLAVRILTQYVTHYWSVAAPKNMAHKKRFAAQVIKRFETGISVFAESAATAQRDQLLGELTKLAQLWQEKEAQELAQATDDLFVLCQRTFRDTAPTAPASTVTLQPQKHMRTDTGSHIAPVVSVAPEVNIDSHNDKTWRDTLLKVAAILCERNPDSPQGYRLRRHALWQNITSAPQAESDGRTPLAAVSVDMVADYQARLTSADMALWQQVEKSLLLAPYWFDGHALSAQIAQRLGYTAVAAAIRDEVDSFLLRLPQLSSLLFSDHTPFISEQTQRWLKQSSGTRSLHRTDQPDNSPDVWPIFNEQGLEAALQYLEKLPTGEPRDHFWRQYLGAQLMEKAGMTQLAQQHYRMLFKAGLRTTLSDWEPALLEQLEEKLTAEDVR
ncbi:TPA: type VI secretion system protein TssA [Salmonella enterica]|nr:type VI secretion system protein TssA [Salmonella enterica]HAK8195235.1 type VI secretion system protein TssA [Salmonella enterica]HAK8434583.1 type VI secretion system protein TssA [Salmonella enterica]HAK8462331.1 type VI secretion system protein TssA [Salmonella enterica]